MTCHVTPPQEQTLFESQLNDKWGSVECHDADMHLGITITQDKEAGTTSLSVERCLENLYEKCKEHLPLHSKAIPVPASHASGESLQPKTDGLRASGGVPAASAATPAATRMVASWTASCNGARPTCLSVHVPPEQSSPQPTSTRCRTSHTMLLQICCAVRKCISMCIH